MSGNSDLSKEDLSEDHQVLMTKIIEMERGIKKTLWKIENRLTAIENKIEQGEY